MNGPSFAHLVRLSDDVGLHEHALGPLPLREHGYCLDDVARGLVVLCREPDPPAELVTLLERYLAFTAHAQAADGRFHNRLGHDRVWRDEPGLGDWWGRALWGLGTAAARAPLPWVRAAALTCFDASAHHRPPSVRAMCFAALGAAEVLRVAPDHELSRKLLADVPAVVGGPDRAVPWPWPEARLFYANAALPEALIAAGELLRDRDVLDDGLWLLAWLLTVESHGDRLSPTPMHGWRAGEHRPAFDQQPLEAAALADACARAHRVTGDRAWLAGVRRAVAWFGGDNDAGVPLLDEETGGGCDGLSRDGRNRNQGAESTLALLSTLQHARAFTGSAG
ncbi:glycosyl transferase [Saccharothrix mutabilis subsp. mutabilis]|uniref:Glycosyl transferase n=1 Tax=Saccharothrix mutabilis subsp. mutabilis TaxID=66855 RepID=A0ABN0UB56_9PSEU